MLALSAVTLATIVVGPSDDRVQLRLWVPIGGGGLLASLRPDSRNR